MRLKGGAGDENIKTGESKPKAKGKNGKPLSKYNQFMQIEVPRVRASDSSLTHAQAFSVPNECPLCRPQKCAGQAKKRQQQNALLPVCPRIRQYICFIFSHVNAAARAGCTNVAHACISKGAKSTLQVACAAGVDAYFHTFLCAPSLFPDSLMLRQAAAKHWSAKSKEEKAAWAP
jgi:hypothetical protein